ncbi:MAG: ABC transporter substrate-binding protein [Halioglobus sp.]
MVIRKYPIGVMLVWLLTASASMGLHAQEHAAYNLVESTTRQVMDVVVAAEAYVETDPERYYSQIQDLLDPLIDFRGFARKVMGPYASSARYRSLDDNGKQQLKDQLDRFTAEMRASLVRTYSKGLLTFGGSRIELVPPTSDQSAEAGDTDTARLSVRQLIYADRKKPYEVIYQMGEEKPDQWKLRNVIIESVNLGEVYRDQFLASARELDGNLDQVIANWTTVVVDVEK